jgi:xylitol oxidase
VAIGLTNWASNYSYTSSHLHRPTSLDELRAIVAKTPKIRALGTRHCFNDIADSAESVTLEAMALELEIDSAARTATFNGGVPYGTLAVELEQRGWALHNMASLPHISVAGATATATHGSGDKNGNLSTAVAGIELVTADGEVVRVKRGDPDFAGMVVNLGALGVVSRITLDVQPSYLVRQQVFEFLPWEVLYERFDAVMSSADSVSLFTNYGESVNQVWLKQRVEPDHTGPNLEELLGAVASGVNLHPVKQLTAESCTEQLGIPGPWLDRLPHFRREAVPASGAEIQTEYMVARSDAVAAIKAVRAIAPLIQPHLLTSEVRSAAADDLWMSTAYGVDTICIHFSMVLDQAVVDGLLPRLEEALAPFNPRPHWGKVFAAPASVIQGRYPRYDDFRQLADRLDPKGKFRNAYLERHLFG